MKIIFDNIIFDLQNFGGVSKSWEKLLSFARTDETLNTEEFGCHLNINHYYSGKLVRKDLRYNQRISRSVRRYFPLFTTSEGIIHSSYFRWPFLKRSNQRYVITVHDCMYELYSTGFRRFVHIFFKRIALKKADAVICVSHNTKRDLERFYNVKNKLVKVIYNGVDDEFQFLEKASESKSEYPTILYVGARDGCKNFQFILTVFRALINERKAMLTCVGPQFNQTELNIISDLGISEFIQNLGSISNTELNDCYNRSTLLLVASEYEGFGITLLEAQAKLTPVVFPNNSSLPEVVAYDETMYQTNNVNQCLEKILMVLDVGLSKASLESGQRLSQKLTWRNNYNETRRLYFGLQQGLTYDRHYSDHFNKK